MSRHYTTTTIVSTTTATSGTSGWKIFWIGMGILFLLPIAAGVAMIWALVVIVQKINETIAANRAAEAVAAQNRKARIAQMERELLDVDPDSWRVAA